MTSSKFSEFWTPSLPLSVPNPRNLPSFCQKLANPLPPLQSRRHMYIAPYFKIPAQIIKFREMKPDKSTLDSTRIQLTSDTHSVD